MKIPLDVVLQLVTLVVLLVVLFDRGGPKPRH